MNQQAKLFIRNLSWSVTEKSLYDLFNEIGEVVSVKIPLRPEDGKPRGFAFIEMQSNDSAQKAVHQLNGLIFQNRDLVVDFQDENRSSRSGSGPAVKNSKLFVRNISDSVTEQMLQALFERIGSVYSAKIAIDRETGHSRGFGFIEMASADEAQQAIDKLNNSFLEGQEIRVDFQDPSRSKNRPVQRNSAYNGSGRSQYGQAFSNYSERW